MTRVKICCIASPQEAAYAVNNGVDAIGLVSEMPSGPGVISEALIAEIAADVPPCVSTFLLTSKQDTESIIQQQKSCKVNTIQICDHLTKGTHADLKAALPGIKIVQVIHVADDNALREAKEIADSVDAILLDSGNQKADIKELGGTGRVHDWRLSKRIVASVNVPVILAGGLSPANVCNAVKEVKPFAVDVCSGVRTNGQLDVIKMKQFCAEVKAADFIDIPL